MQWQFEAPPAPPSFLNKTKTWQHSPFLLSENLPPGAIVERIALPEALAPSPRAPRSPRSPRIGNKQVRGGWVRPVGEVEPSTDVAPDIPSPLPPRRVKAPLIPSKVVPAADVLHVPPKRSLPSPKPVRKVILAAEEEETPLPPVSDAAEQAHQLELRRMSILLLEKEKSEAATFEKKEEATSAEASVVCGVCDTECLNSVVFCVECGSKL